MFDIDDVLTLTALLPVVTMDTHTRTQTNTHTHTCKGVAATTCKTLHCTVVRCVGANAYNGHSYFGQLKQKAEERERERGVFDKSMSNRRSSWAVQWQSTIGISLCGLRACTLL